MTLLNDPSAGELLRVRDLTVAYSVGDEMLRASRDIDFDVAPGETLAIVGESGSGKSSMLVALSKLLPPSARMVDGTVELAGEGDLARLTTRQLRALRGSSIGYIPQQPMSSFNPTMKIGRQVAEPLMIHARLSYRQSLPRVREALAEMGLRDVDRVVEAYPHQLSGGMLQRAMIAQAVIANPKLLLADEPTSALDVTVQRQIIALLKRVQDQQGLSMIIVSHDLSVISQIADRIIVVYGGRILEQGPRDEILHRPRNPYTAALLASMVGLRAERKAPLPALPGAPLTLRQVDSEPGCPFRHRCPRVIDVCAERFPEPVTDGTTFFCHNPEGTR